LTQSTCNLLDPFQPLFCFSWILKPKQFQMPMLWQSEQLGVFTFSSPVCFEQPVIQGFLRPEFEMRPNRFSVCTPKQFLSPPAREGATRELPEDSPERIIQPDDGFRFGPDQIADDMIIPCDNPSFGLRRFLNTGAENLKRGFLPVWFPMQSVEFDEIHVQPFSESLRKRGFA